MEWLNANNGIITVVFSILILILAGICIWILIGLRNKIAVQKLSFTGFYSINKDSRQCYAGLTIGNKSLNDLGLCELGIQNGNINFPLTDLYKKEKSMKDDARIVIEQRSAIAFNLSCDELKKLVVEVNGKTFLKTLRLYAVDLTGTVYRGKIPAVKKLLVSLLNEEKTGAPVNLPAMEAAVTQVQTNSDTE